MKVYVITSGRYSDYHIDAVSLDKDEAEAICATLNNKRDDDFCDVEEYDTEDIKVKTQNEIKARFRMIVEYKSGEERNFYEKVLVSEDINNISVVRYGDRLNRIDIIATLSRDTKEDKARKIMYDRIAKFKAERAGI